MSTFIGNRMPLARLISLYSDFWPDLRRRSRNSSASATLESYVRNIISLCFSPYNQSCLQSAISWPLASMKAGSS